MSHRAMKVTLTIVIITIVSSMALACSGGKTEFVLGATTTVQDTGLLDELVADFEKDSGYKVKPVVQGSGQILTLARQGELDVIMTHSPADEKKLVDDGFTTSYQQYMENFFEIVGPAGDPAGVASASSMTDAFKRIAATGDGFISRGDGSGTNKRELDTWATAEIDPKGQSWYQESAVGQGQNLLVASDKSVYTLTDTSTFVALKDKVNLKVLLLDEKKPNIYSVLELNKDRLSNVNVEAGKAWADYLTSERGQKLIRDFGADKYGDPLFKPLVHP